MSELNCTTKELPESSACLLRLSGELSVSNSQQMYQQVLESCETFPEVQLLLNDVTSFDVSAMQILIAALHHPATKVSIRVGDGADCVSHWLDLAGLTEAVFAEVA